MVNGTFCEEVRSILSEVKAIRDGQNSSESILGAIQVDNKSLWRDVAILRSQHHKQRRVIEKLIQFLLSLIQRRSNMVAKKRKVRLMIDASTRCAGTPGSASSENGSAGFVDGGYVSPSSASLNGERPISASPSALVNRNDQMGVAYADQVRPMSVSSSPPGPNGLMGSPGMQFANQAALCRSPKAQLCSQIATSGSPPISRFLGATSNGNGCAIQAELANSIGAAGQQWAISTNHSEQQQQQQHQQQHQQHQQQQYSSMPTGQANDVGGQLNFGGQHLNTCCSNSNSARQEPIWW